MDTKTVTYRPRATTPTGVIVARAFARAQETNEPVAIKVPDALGHGMFWPIKPDNSPELLAHIADTIEAMRRDVCSEGRCITLYCNRGASSKERVDLAIRLSRHSKMPVLIEGQRKGRTFRVLVMPRSEAHRKVPELIKARGG